MLLARPRWAVTLPDYAPDVRFSPDGERLAAATVAGPVVVLDASSGAEHRRLEGHADGALSVAWCTTRALVATGGTDGAVALHDSPGSAPRARVPLGRGWVEHLAWSPQGDVLAAAVGRSLCFLSPDGEVRGRFDDHPSTVTGLAWHAARRAWITSAYGVVSLLAPDEPEPIGQHYFRTSLLGVHPSPDGRFVASGTQDPLVHVWDLEDDTNEANLTGYAGKVSVLAWSPRDAVLATGAGASVVAWYFAGGDPFRAPPRDVPLAGLGKVTALVFTPAGELLAGTDAGAVVEIELGREGAAASTVVARVASAVCSLVPSPDGGVVVAAAGGGLASFAFADR